jgi:hypothetical protein
MIRDAHPIVQALLGCLLTWALTAAGAATVFLPCRSTNHKLSGASAAANMHTHVQMHRWALPPVS